MYLLEAQNITKRYENHIALSDVTIKFERGKVHALLGPNGAGKTTLIRILNQITAADSGRVVFEGRDLCRKDLVHVGYLPEERGLYKKMSVADHIIYLARLRGLRKDEILKNIAPYISRFNMEGWWNKKIDELSKGMAQKVQFVAAIAHNPKLIIFDEPLSGLDPITSDVIKREFVSFKDQGKTVILSTHNMSSVEESADNITLINQAKNILSGDKERIREQYSSNIYNLCFKGDTSALIEAGIISKDLSATENNGILQTKFSIDEEMKRDTIARINSLVDIVSLSKHKVSMEEVFINAVKRDGHE